MKKELKGFIIGVVLTAMLMSTIVFADGVQKTIDVVLNKVNVKVNGKAVSGNNILYDGTTYVPLREIAEILGKEVGWNGDTNTASINDKGFKETVSKEKEEPIKVSEETLSQKNAVKTAKDYLDYSSFSKSGLIKQLKFEGYSEEDANYAVSQLTVDWKEQAVKTAEGYLDYSSFSKSGLIKQLEFEGFTNEQAVYAADEVGF